MNTSTIQYNSQTVTTIECLCAIAVKRLAACYGSIDAADGFPSDSLWPALSMVDNLRYIIISQIGIKHWQQFHPNTSLPDLSGHIRANVHCLDNAGDLALALWASLQANPDDYTPFAEPLVNNWKNFAAPCNAVELAWVVKALVQLALSGKSDRKSNQVLKDAHCTLLSLYRPGAGLFARHNRRSLSRFLPARIACFADQVYSILALSSFGQAFDHRQSIDAALAVTDTICRLQGPAGQWWWHYDTQTGRVAEEYPVFSVHQDAMAPMALLALDVAAGTNHTRYIEKGLSWLNQNNELHERMVLPEKNITWRDIHRRELPKMYRFARSLLAAANLQRLHRLCGRNPFGYVVNRECHPYHLGWLLYCWADFPSRCSHQTTSQNK